MERMGELDAVVLATHFQWGQQPKRAAHFYTQAAERLFERHDLQGTMRCVDAALECGVSGEALVRLRALQAVVLFWMAQLPRALELGVPALAELKAGSPLWCRLIGSLILASSGSARPELSARLSRLLVDTTPEPEAIDAYSEAVALVGLAFIWFGERQKVETLLGRLMEVDADVMARSPMARGVVCFLSGNSFYFFGACPWRGFKVAEQGWRDFSAVASERGMNVMQILSGLSLAATGELEGAAELLREAVATARRTEQHLMVETALVALSLVLANSPTQVERQEAHAWALERVEVDSNPYVPGMRHALLARMNAEGGALREAELHARKACEMLVPFQAYVAYARTVLSTILKAQGRASEARQVAEVGVRELERMGSEGVYAVAMHLALAEACFAEGDESTGEEALHKALRCVRARASDFPEPEARERFLRQVAENARTLELAHQRWGEATV